MSDNADQESFATKLKADLAASLVVFLVALPLSLGIAGACEIPVEFAVAVGIMSAVIGGIVVGWFAGCPLQVTGPAAGLISVVFQIVTDGNVGFLRLGTVVFLAGLIQLVAAWLKLGQWFRSVVPSVIEGMLAGIGLLILAQQFHVMLDYKAPGSQKPAVQATDATHGDAKAHSGPSHFAGVKNLLAIPQAVWKAFNDPKHRPAALLGFGTIAIIIAWERLTPQWFRILPAPLIGVSCATLVASIWKLDIAYLKAPDSIFTSAALLPRLDFAAMVNSTTAASIWMYAITVAIVASAESLITAAAVDRMKTHGPRTNFDKELFSQGIGNTLCGVLGLLPLTGVIVRSSANVRFGGRTRMSTMLHGLWMLLFVALFPGFLRYIPVAALAAILVYTGLRLAHPEPFLKLKKFSLVELAIGLTTFVTVFVVDLLAGISVGMGLAIANLLYGLAHLGIRRVDDPQKKRIELHLSGAASFVSLTTLENALLELPPGYDIHVEIDELSHIDHACLETLLHWEQQYEKAGGSLSIDWNDLTALRQPTANKA